MNKAVFQRDTTAGVIEIPQDEITLLERHDIYFETRLAENQAQVKSAQEIRYQVYCLERKFENPGEHEDGLESDDCDGRSLQGLLFHRPTGDAIGTVRMIQPDFSTAGILPVGQLLLDNGFHLEDYVPLRETVEVSRFAISKDFRRRSTDNFAAGSNPAEHKLERIRRGNLPCLSLIQFLVRQSALNGVSHWAAVMEAKLLRMLAAMGIEFQSVGPLVMHHGLRQPCYIDVHQMLANVQRQQPDYWAVLTNGGELRI